MYLSAAAPVLRPMIKAAVAVFNLITRPDWQQAEKLPRGGAILVVNHISNVDPLVIGAFLVRHRILPRFLAKESLFGVPVVGAILRGAKQIPVRRGSLTAPNSLAAAVDVLAEGGCVVIYPEGTITADPQLWPMRGKTGAARLAELSGSPVIPVGQWGAEQIMRGKEIRMPRLCPRKTVAVKVGDPISFDDHSGAEPGDANEKTLRIMRAITDLVAELRNEDPPAVAYDPARPGGDSGHDR